MKQLTARAAIIGTLAVLPTMATTVINFDDVTGANTALSNQYAAEGVIFNNIERAASFTFNIHPPSTPNYASPFWTNTSDGTFSFVDPSNPGTPAYTNTVTITMVGLTVPPAGNYSGATIDALDVFGNVIAGQTQVIPAVNTATSNVDLTFTGQVHAIRFTHTAGTSGALPFDNLTFGDLTPAPEPSVWILMVTGLACLVVARRKRTAS